jgi:hypothetical protein
MEADTDFDDATMLDLGAKECVAGGVAFVAFLEQPDEVVQLQRADAVSSQYQLMYRRSAVTLARAQSLTVDGVTYTVREVPRKLDDGAFGTALLSKP